MDLAHQDVNQLTDRYRFDVSTDNIVGINMNSIQFASDDNRTYAELYYQPLKATEVEKKLNYLVALNAYNTAHQNNIETKVVFKDNK